MGASADVLVSVPNAQLHQVVGNVQQLLQHGTFTVSIVSPEPGAAPETSKVEAGVGAFTWALGKHLPALKAAGGIYSFALAHTKSEYLIVVLPQGEFSEWRVRVHAASDVPAHTGDSSRCIFVPAGQTRPAKFSRRCMTSCTTCAHSAQSSRLMQQQKRWTSCRGASRRPHSKLPRQPAQGPAQQQVLPLPLQPRRQVPTLPHPLQRPERQASMRTRLLVLVQHRPWVTSRAASTPRPQAATRQQTRSQLGC